MLGKLEKFQGDLYREENSQHPQGRPPSGRFKMANNAVATRFFKESWHISGVPFTRRKSQRSQFTPVFLNPYGKRAVRPSLSNSASSWKVLTELTIQKVFSQNSNNGQSLFPLKDIRKALEEKDREYIWWPVSTRESLASLTPDSIG